MLLSLNTAINTIIQLLVLYSLDMYLHNTELPVQTRWHLTHAWANLTIASSTYRNAIAMLLGLTVNVWSPVDSSAILLVTGLHLIHFANYQVSSTDRWHHFMYVATFCPLLLIWNWGLVQDSFVFMMCGLPGAIDYATLVLVDYGVITELQQKRLNCYLTVYVRSPLVVITAYLAAINMAASPCPSWLMVVALTLALYNTQSHTMTTVEAYYQVRLDSERKAKAVATALAKEKERDVV